MTTDQGTGTNNNAGEGVDNPANDFSFFKMDGDSSGSGGGANDDPTGLNKTDDPNNKGEGEGEGGEGNVVKKEEGNNDDPSKKGGDPSKNGDDPTNKEADKGNNNNNQDPGKNNQQQNVKVDVRPMGELLLNKLGIKWDDSYIPEEKSGNVDSLIELMAQVVEQSSRPEYANDEVKQLDEYIRKGGTFQKFYSAHFENVDYSKLDVKVPSDQQKLITDYYKNSTKWSDARISAEVKRVFDRGDESTEATEAKTFLEELDKEKKANLDKQLEADKAEEVKRRNDKIAEVTTTILESDIKSLGFNLNDKQKKEFVDFLTKPVKDTGKSAYGMLFESVPNFGTRLALMAYFGFYDQKNVGQNLQNDLVTKIEEQLRNATNSGLLGGKGTGSLNERKAPENNGGDADYAFFKLGGQ